MDTSQFLFHMCPKALWDHCVSTRTPYYPPTYQQDGFIHLTKDPKFLLTIANHFYREPRDTEWVLLALEPSKLTAKVVFEAAAPVGDRKEPEGKDVPLFPHLYGTIDFAAVAQTWRMERDSGTGEFLSIVGFPHPQ